MREVMLAADRELWLSYKILLSEADCMEVGAEWSGNNFALECLNPMVETKLFEISCLDLIQFWSHHRGEALKGKMVSWLVGVRQAACNPDVSSC